MSREARGVVLIMYGLLAFGTVMIYSASSVYADQTFGSATYFLRRQLFYVLLGTMLFNICAQLNPEILRRHAKWLVSLSLFLLVLVLIPPFGHKAGGARRWIGTSFFTFQPVEFVKLTLCLYLSDYLSRKIKPLVEGSAAVLVPPLVVLSAVLLLVIVQPDLGSCVFILLVTSILFFLAGIPMRYVFIAAVPILTGIVFLILVAPYRLKRVVAFLNPWKDPAGSGFQIIQSFVAFASGGISGVGLGQSTQKLFYLPQSYTDFIFSIIGEELGIIGAVFVLLLYVMFFLLGYKIAHKSHEPFYRMYAYALVLMITIQALLHVLVTVGLIPTKGLPLPFISYGGSALIFNMAAVGILVAVDKHMLIRKFRPD